MTIIEATDFEDALFALNNCFDFAVIESNSDELGDEETRDAQATVSCDILIQPKHLDKIPRILNWQEACKLNEFPILIASGLNMNDVILALEEIFGQKFSHIARYRPVATARA